jgi:hypothetical protein
MARRFRPRSTPRENIGIILHSFPWKVLLILPVFIVLAIPTYEFGTHAASGIIPNLTTFFYNIANTSPQPTPIPIPTFPKVLPRVGSIVTTVGDGSSCDEILAFEMRMADAGQVFSDAQPSTVRALDAAIGQDCHKLQPGMQLKLSPQYPLVALGGEILRISSSLPQQAAPTPLIKVPQDPNAAPDCSGGCTLTVELQAGQQVRVAVDTTLAMHKGDWVWFQAMLARQKVKGFDAYPYADPRMTFNGMSLQACDFQVNGIHDNQSLLCSQVNPNTIRDDGGAWMFGATGTSGLDHWHYRIHVPANTQLLLWLTLDDNGNLTYTPGDPVYRYNSARQVYVKL